MQRGPLVVVLVLFVALNLLVRLGSFMNPGKQAARTQEVSAAAGQSAELAIGRVLMVGMTDGGPILMATDQASQEELMKVGESGNHSGLKRLVASARIFAIDSGTRVRVLIGGGRNQKVRVLEGPMAGHVGWVQSTWLSDQALAGNH